MSFNVVTALWIAKLFIIYALMVVVLPGLIMRRLLKGRSWTQKFVFCGKYAGGAGAEAGRHDCGCQEEHPLL